MSLHPTSMPRSGQRLSGSPGYLDSIPRDLRVLAPQLGIELRRDGLAPCPVCGATARSRSERRRRAPVLVGRGWRCLRCDASGDAVSLVAAVVGTGPRDYAAAARWARERHPVPSSLRRERPPDPPPRERDPDRVAEARELWRRARVPGPVEALIRYASHRRGWTRPETLRLGGLGMLGWLAPGTPCPRWARYWARPGWQLITPLCGPHGEIVDVRVRWTGEPDQRPGWASKSMAGRDAVVCGTVLAPCPVARALLQAGPTARPGELDGPDGWPVQWDGTVDACEGDADTWTHAVALMRRARYPAATPWPAVLGYAQGSFVADIAARIPTGTRVRIWPHRDPPRDGQPPAGIALALPVIDACEAAGLTVEVRFAP